MSDEHPAPLRRGDRVDRNWVTINKLNELLQPALSEIRRLSSGLQDFRQFREHKSGGSGGGKVQRFTVVTEFADYLSCRKQNADGTTEIDLINVAKPLTLRQSYWNGRTISGWTYSGNVSPESRTASYAGPAITGGLQIGDSIAEILDPVYSGAVEIFAAQADGSTGVVIASQRLTWIDLNVDARRFVAARDRVDVCKVVAGVQTMKKMVIDGGPAFS